ncbi:phage holin family protein [Oscillospiraceae bacterium 42-9]
MKNALCTGAGIVGSAIAALFGGWDAALITLIIFMGVDYVTGLLVAGVFHNSEKTKNGALESRAGWKGLCRKGVTLLVVLVACRLDLLTGANFIRDAAVIAFIANEAISILENAGLMGVPIPVVITRAIDVLKNKAKGVEKMTKGVDISVHNGNVDFNALKAAGIQFVIIRCGYGSDFTYQDDERFAENVRKAEAADMPWGTYLYSYALNRDMAKSEAQHVLRLLDGKKPAYGVWYDVEDEQQAGADLVSICETFCTAIEKAGLYVGGILPCLGGIPS